MCLCGEPAVRRISRKENDNKGKSFLTCPRPQGGQCDFFKWEEQLTTTSVAAEGFRCSHCQMLGHYAKACLAPCKSDRCEKPACVAARSGWR